jgi:phosphate transport system substrate-binding protein
MQSERAFIRDPMAIWLWRIRLTMTRSTTFMLLMLASSFAAAAPMIIAGTGASQDMLKELAVIFERSNADCPTEVPKSVGSRGGIRTLLAGKASLARVSRPLKEKNRAKGLHYHAFAETQVVFATHADLRGVDKLTRAQVIDIYTGRIANWNQVGGPDHAIFPLMRDGGTTLRTIMKHVNDFPQNPKAAKLTYSSLDTRELMLAHPYTIGFLPATLLTGTPLLTIEIDGVSSSNGSGDSGSLRFPLPLGLVYKEPLEGCAARFMEYLKSDDARQAIRRNNAVPLN